MILEHSGEHLPVITFDGEEELFFHFLAEQGYEPEWVTHYLISINNVQPFENFGEFLAEWGHYRDGNVSRV